MRFVAYGLTIESVNLDLHLPLGKGDPQVVVCVAPVAKPPGNPDAPFTSVFHPGEFRVHWRGVGTFLISQGREILVDPEPGVELAVIQLFLNGPVIAFLLHQRGLLVLHASVVSINGVAIGFLGEKGWGKSTTAAALNARGHALVADDLLITQVDNEGTPMVQPGPPNFKLWPEAAAASFGDNPETLARLHTQIEKRTRSANTVFLAEALPLRHIFILDRGTQLEFVPMTPPDALLALVRHSYFSGIMKSLGGVGENFQQCAHLTRRVSFSFLKRPRDLNALGEIASLVEHEVAQYQEEAQFCALTPAQ